MNEPDVDELADALSEFAPPESKIGPFTSRWWANHRRPRLGRWIDVCGSSLPTVPKAISYCGRFNGPFTMTPLPGV